MKKDIRPRTHRPSWYHPAFGLAAVLVALPAAVHAQETAKQADSFVDGIGINIKLNYYQDTPYGNYPMVQQMLQQAGIRHVRGGADPYSDLGQHEVAGLNKLGAVGIKTDAVFAPTYNPNNLSTSQLILAQIGSIASCIESAEGPNETDAGFTFNGKPFPQSTIDYQNALWATIKSSQYASLPVIAPSISFPPKSPQIAGMQYVSNYGNTHSYHGARNPETSEVNLGMFNFYIPFAQNESGTIPIISTETGNWVGTAKDPSMWMPPITAVSQGKYTLRTFAEYFNDGIVRTYIHELIDEHPSPNVAESSFGILYNDWTPKPAYTGIKNLISTLADPGPAFTPGALTYTMTDPLGNLHHVLLQKRDGSFDLILWQAVKSYDFNNLVDTPAAPVPVTLTFGTNVGQIAVFDPSTSASPVSTSSNVASTTVNVPDNLLILHITPQAAVESPYPGPNAPNLSMGGPTIIQADNYDNGGPGLGYSSLYSSNPGPSKYRNNGGDLVGIGPTADPGGNGYYVGWTAQGQFLNYMVTVQTAGFYTVTFQDATGGGSGGTFNLGEVNSTNQQGNTGSVVASPTATWDTWASTPASTLYLDSGTQILKLYQETGGYSLDYMTFTPAVVSGTVFSSGGAPAPATALKLAAATAKPAAGHPLSALAAFDGSVTTFFASDASGGYVGKDAGKAVPVTQITFAPRSGYEARMVGGVFEGSNTSTTSGYTTLGTVTATPKAGLTNTLRVTGGRTYRYLRFRSPAGGYCNVAEIQFQN